jgi:hypothetical protein
VIPASFLVEPQTGSRREQGRQLRKYQHYEHVSRVSLQRRSEMAENLCHDGRLKRVEEKQHLILVRKPEITRVEMERLETRAPTCSVMIEPDVALIVMELEREFNALDLANGYSAARKRTRPRQDPKSMNV